MRYYIADPHFFHGNLNTKMDHRGFESVEKMNAYMLQKWNSKVRKNDEVVILGDLSWGKAEETNELLVHRIISNQPYNLPDFPSASLSSIGVAPTTPHSSALHIKNHSALYG